MPAVSYTLVSIVMLDEKGYHVHIGAGHLELTSLQGKRVSCISWTLGQLYKVIHTLDSANIIEPILVMELHRCLGHIAVKSAHKLVTSSTIVGIELDLESKCTDCDACIFAHTTCHPIPKVRISLPAQNFGDEIHTNVWEPSLIATSSSFSGNHHQRVSDKL